MSMKRSLASMIAVIVLPVVLAGCTDPAGGGTPGSGASGGSTPAGSCPAGPVVPWSSEEGSPSRLTALTSAALRDVGTVAVKGITPGGVNANKVGGHAFFLSAGDVQHDVTHLVDWSLTDCQARATRLANVFNPLSLATDGKRFYTTNTLNARSFVRRFDAAGVLGAERAVPDVGVTCLVLDADNGAVYAFANEFRRGAPDGYVLIVLDAETLQVRSRHPLPLAAASVSSAVLHGGKLIYPLTYDEESRELGRELAVLDVAGLGASGKIAARTIDLAADLPYLLRLSGDTLIVGHTFLNPAFGPIAGMRHISRVDLATAKVTGHEVAAGIVDVDADDAHVYLLGQADENADRFVIETYAAATMRRTESVPVDRPTRGGYFYPAGIIAR